MKQFTEKDLVDFGNQLLSKERDVLHEINLHQVTDADVEKFKEGREWKHTVDLKKEKVSPVFYKTEKEAYSAIREFNRKQMTNAYIEEQKEKLETIKIERLARKIISEQNDKIEPYVIFVSIVLSLILLSIIFT